MSRSLFKSLFTLVMLATIGSVAFARRRSANPQLDSFMNLAERMSDRQHQKFCQRFAAAFDARAAELWPKVHDECIENMIRKGANLPANFPKLDDQIQGRIVKIHEKCSSVVKNPCKEEDWKKVKKCVKDEAFNTNLLTSPQGLPKNMPSVSLGLASAILDCTDKIIKAN